MNLADTNFDAANLAVYLDPDMPGYQVAALDGGATVGGIFDDGARLGVNRSLFRCRSVDAAGVRVGDAISVDSTAFRVAEKRSVNAMTVLALAKT